MGIAYEVDGFGHVFESLMGDSAGCSKLQDAHGVAGAEGIFPISDTQLGPMGTHIESVGEDVENRPMESVAVVVEEVHFGECPAVDGNLQHAGVHSHDGMNA